MKFSRLELRIAMPHPDVGGGGQSAATSVFLATETAKTPAFVLEEIGQHWVKIVGPTATRMVNVAQVFWADPLVESQQQTPVQHQPQHGRRK